MNPARRAEAVEATSEGPSSQSRRATRATVRGKACLLGGVPVYDSVSEHMRACG